MLLLSAKRSGVHRSEETKVVSNNANVWDGFVVMGWYFSLCHRAHRPVQWIPVIQRWYLHIYLILYLFVLQYYAFGISDYSIWRRILG